MRTQTAGPSSDARRMRDPATGVILACSFAVLVTVGAGRGIELSAALLIVVSALVAWHRWLLSWHVLLNVAIATVLFVPIGRYTLAIDLPSALDLYRIVVGLILLGWAAALLVDPTVRVQRTPLDGPIAALVAASLASVAVNYSRVLPLASAVLKSVTLFLSLVLLYYFVTSVVTSAERIIALTRFVVSGVAVVAFFALVEQETGLNVFDHLASVLPILRFEGAFAPAIRNGVARAFGSADHPIALGCLFGMTVPIGFALARSRSAAWWAPTAVILVGILSTGSRTPVVAVVVGVVVLLWLRPRDIAAVLPLAVALFIALGIVSPKTITSMADTFFPASGLLAQQQARASDPTLNSGRANLVPRIEEGMRRPIFGQGVGTRQTGSDNPLRNAPILDNQWLGNFLDVGLLGLGAWCWLLVRVVRRLGRVARTTGGTEGLLAAGLAASVSGFAAGMLTYDTFAFVQETVFFWVLLALAAALVELHWKTDASPTQISV